MFDKSQIYYHTGHRAQFDRRIIFPYFLLEISDFIILLLFFLITELNLLIPAIFAQIFNPTTEFANHTGIPAKQGKTEIETHPITT